MDKKKVGRPNQKVIKAKTDLSFEINFDFTVGRGNKYEKNKKVINIIKKEIENEKKDK